MFSFFSFLQDAENYEERKIGRIEPEDNKGVGVSTAYSSDEGFETALLDAYGAHPVERYKTAREASLGHKKWVRKARKVKQVIELGDSNGYYAENEKINIERVK